MKTRPVQTALRLLRRNSSVPLRCPGTATRPISTVQSRWPPRAFTSSHLAASSPQRFIRHSSIDSTPPGASFVRSSDDPDAPEAQPETDQDAPDALSTPTTPHSDNEAFHQQQQVYQRPSYQLTFTCKPCGHRSAHIVTKQAYHFGTTLIRCPGCRDRHVISDHLKVSQEINKRLLFIEI